MNVERMRRVARQGSRFSPDAVMALLSDYEAAQAEVQHLREENNDLRAHLDSIGRMARFGWRRTSDDQFNVILGAVGAALDGDDR